MSDIIRNFNISQDYGEKQLGITSYIYATGKLDSIKYFFRFFLFLVGDFCEIVCVSGDASSSSDARARSRRERERKREWHAEGRGRARLGKEEEEEEEEEEDDGRHGSVVLRG